MDLGKLIITCRSVHALSERIHPECRFWLSMEYVCVSANQNDEKSILDKCEKNVNLLNK